MPSWFEPDVTKQAKSDTEGHLASWERCEQCLIIPSIRSLGTMCRGSGPLDPTCSAEDREAPHMCAVHVRRFLLGLYSTSAYPVPLATE